MTFLFIAVSMTLMCLGLQTVMGGYALYIFRHSRVATSQSDHMLFASFRAIAAVLLVLMLGNILQIIAWAQLYIYLKEFDTFEAAFYFSGVTFTSLGYGDVTLTDEYRSLAPIQTAVGLMMFGISTSILFAVLQAFKSR